MTKLPRPVQTQLVRMETERGRGEAQTSPDPLFSRLRGGRGS